MTSEVYGEGQVSDGSSPARGAYLEKIPLPENLSLPPPPSDSARLYNSAIQCNSATVQRRAQGSPTAEGEGAVGGRGGGLGGGDTGCTDLVTSGGALCADTLEKVRRPKRR
eukprot:3507862-Pyramimonas_sp.AAC.1